MDHSSMDHNGMDMGHGDMCNMNMLFTWDTTNLCIIFRWWHVRSTFTLIVSLICVAILTAGYELVRELSRRYELSSQEYMNSLPRKGAGQQEKKVKFAKAGFYAVQVFYSFFIMLLFMTYNGWVMLAVAVGAFMGYLGFGNSSATKSVACH
ncbi:solute carrier family 31 (copper transporter), member 1, partial [Lecanoromycetidae sp. Uapishka_2]